MGSWKGLGLILLALLLAVTAGGVAFIYLNSRPAISAEAPPTIPVVTATVDMTFGTRLTEDHLKVVQFPEESVPVGSYADIDSVLGQTTKVFLVSGEPVLASKLSLIGGGLSVRIPANMRATSVDVNEISGVSGFVLPGDRVDVLVTVDNAQGNNNAVSRIILQNIEVLAAGVKTKTENNNPVQVQSVTLQLTPTDAGILALAMNEGKIHLALRNPADQEIVEAKPTNTKEVLGLSKPVRRTYRPKPKPPEPEPEPVVEEPKPDPTYTIIKNGEVQKKNFATEAGKDEGREQKDQKNRR